MNNFVAHVQYVNQSNYHHLTLGKVYRVYEHNVDYKTIKYNDIIQQLGYDETYTIWNDKGDLDVFPAEWFKKVPNNKLEALLHG